MSQRQALLLVLGLELIVAMAGVLSYGLTLEGLQAITRFSGRLSLAIFSIIFLLHGNQKIRIETFLSDQYFLMFALAHGIHLIELLNYIILSGTALIPIRLAGGFVAYLIIFAMPVIQLLHQKNKITEKQFSISKLVYLYYVWFIFFMTYLPRVRGQLPNVGGNYSEFVLLLSWVSLMMGIKIQQLMARPTKS